MDYVISELMKLRVCVYILPLACQTRQNIMKICVLIFMVAQKISHQTKCDSSKTNSHNFGE